MKTEKQIAKEVIEYLEQHPTTIRGICSALYNLGYSDENESIDDDLKFFLPKLYKYLSNRNNYKYSFFGSAYNIRIMGRVKGIHDGYYWKPYNPTPRIAILKKVYKIK